MKNIENLRHPKEKLYFYLCAIFSSVLWVPAIFYLNFYIFIFIVFLILNQAKTIKMLYGNAVFLQKGQLVEVYKIFEELCKDLEMESMPPIFLLSKNSSISAFSLVILSKKYLMVRTETIDLFLEKNHIEGLKMILGRELGYHVAGNASFWKNTFLIPAMMMPFLGATYVRACTHTADNIGAYLAKDKQKAIEALITSILGSNSSQDKINKNLLIKQEKQASGFYGFIEEIYNFRPRLTRRIIFLDRNE